MELPIDINMNTGDNVTIVPIKNKAPMLFTNILTNLFLKTEKCHSHHVVITTGRKAGICEYRLQNQPIFQKKRWTVEEMFLNGLLTQITPDIE
jgi:hypothetical protein